MDATHSPLPAPPLASYSSRPGALIWSFRKSRDAWKSKHQELKAAVKGYQVRIADLAKSRAKWRREAEQAREQLAAVEAEMAGPRVELSA